MIFGSSNDPVELKRIPIKVWCLKDEIIHALNIRLEESSDLTQVDISDIKAFYSQNPVEMKQAQTEQAPEEELAPLDDSEDEMAKALAEAANEEAAPENPEAAESEKPTGEEISAETEAEKTETSENPPQTEEKTPEKKGYQRIIPPDEMTTTGFALLTDMNMDGVLFFAKKPFTPGQTILISLEIPNGFILSAEVVKCFDYESKSRIISEIKPGHRIQSRFIFSGVGERTLLRNFIQSFTPAIPKNVEEENKEAPAAEGSGD